MEVHDAFARRLTHDSATQAQSDAVYVGACGKALHDTKLTIIFPRHRRRPVLGGALYQSVCLATA